MEQRFQNIHVKGGHHHAGINRNIHLEQHIQQNLSGEAKNNHHYKITVEGAGHGSGRGYSAIDNLSYEGKGNRSSDKIIESIHHGGDRGKASRVGDA